VEVRPFLLATATVAGILVAERRVGAAAAASAGALVVGAGAAGAAWFVRPPARSALAVCACALVGFGAMARALEGQDRSPLAAAIASRGTATLHATAADDARSGSFDTSLLVRVDTGHGTHRTLLASASGSEASALRVVEAGDRMVITGRLAPLRHGSFDDRGRWRHAVGRIDAVRLVALARPRGLLAVANALRTVLLRGTRPLAPTPRALTAGFLLGDTRAVPAPVAAAYRDSGLSHLLAVSGANVAFVLALGAPLLRRLRLGARTAVALAIVLVFAAMTRFEPSVLRASAMAAITLLATLGGRPVSSLRVLSYAVVALLLADPFLVHSVGFGLSCGASAGIALCARPLAARLPGPRPVREPLAVSLGAQLGVLPVLLSVFGSVPLVTPLANLVAAPAAELLGVYGVFASAVSGLLPAAGPFLQLPTAALVGWITAVARAGAAVPVQVDGRGFVGLVSVVAATASVACLRAGRAVPEPAAR
jgi:competence protein ComEC